MDKKILFLLVAAFTLVVIIGFLVAPAFFGGDRNAPENSQSDKAPSRGNLSSDNYPAEDQKELSEGASKTRGSITATKLPDGRFLLENKSGGYQVIVSSEWMLSEVEKEFKLFYGDAANLKPGIELNNIAILNITVLNNQNRYEFAEWFKNLDSFTRSDLGSEKSFKKVQIGAGSAFGSYRKSDKIDDFGKIAPRDDSSVIDYLFFKDYRVYRITCAASGSNYDNLSQVCENQIKDFSVK